KSSKNLIAFKAVRLLSTANVRTIGNDVYCCVPQPISCLLNALYQDWTITPGRHYVELNRNSRNNSAA
ncbi:MAG TPA: hypothetical protein VN825_04375, partial [Candidatus Acidoferrum sp.]|nr:hypothetical protein [Candidatus Acidoferrum sp.]